MKAIFYNKYGNSNVLEVAELSNPEVKKGHALVKMHAMALNPRDIAIRVGALKIFSGTNFPKLTGADFSGVIEKLPAGSRSFNEGDEVFGYLEDVTNGISASLVNIPINYLALKPDKISHATASTLGCAYLTALQALRDKANITKGSKVAIYGASGGVGTAAIQLANYFEAEVTAISNSRNRSYCKEQGAHHFIAYDQQDVFSGNQDYDIFLQVYVNGGDVYKKAKKITKNKGAFVSLNPNPAIKLKHLFGKPAYQSMMVKNKREDLDFLAKATDDGIIKPYIDKSFRPEDIIEAHSILQNGQSKGKLIVNF
jgi:NADPH:quinone reductase-like Zn-dependent oxidoreductase